VDQFTYFMIRLRRPLDAVPPELLTGVVERLASGEKRTFSSADELLLLLASRWPTMPPTLGPDRGNA
jgi:hypothetical protein